MPEEITEEEKQKLIDELLKEKKELEDELAGESDPALRADIEEDLREVEQDLRDLGVSV